ncbi:hypothetical protein CK203_063387 [Vitis vinifera]|uniref:Uncharacterized protein n=1 Tax=Vitis vinifera TaxID=29760 RepID=A0A438G660_VITVI|nr:hypothetical protein CK203_063387 [Vitis vinifera]
MSEEEASAVAIVLRKLNHLTPYKPDTRVPPQDSNPSPRLKDDKVALLVPSVLVAQMDSNPSPRLKDDKVALLVPSVLLNLLLSKEEQTTLAERRHPDSLHNTSGYQHDPSGYKSSGWSIKVKRVLHAITTSSHGPHPITCRMRRQEEVTASHFPRSFYNRFPRSLTAASPTMVTTESRTPCVLRIVSIHLAATWTTGYARRQHWRRLWEILLFILIQSLAKMATPSQSRSSGREEEDNHEWRQAIEKRQLASEKQLRALLQETERLREENAVLRIQASTSGPPRRQRSKGQVANSRPEPESIYPGSTGAVPGTYNARPHEPRTPMPRAPRPQEPGRSRPPVATTRAPRPDPMMLPWCRTYLRIVTPWSPSDAERSLTPSGTTSWEKPPKRATHWLHQQKAG